MNIITAHVPAQTWDCFFRRIRERIWACEKRFLPDMDRPLEFFERNPQRVTFLPNLQSLSRKVNLQLYDRPYLHAKRFVHKNNTSFIKEAKEYDLLKLKELDDNWFKIKLREEIQDFSPDMYKLFLEFYIYGAFII